ncbi:hypothetical protein ACSAZL_08530 [Methanosarcina sp. T3]|uniref:hypothetical protein n=1 Tax=Methanosarcina sp. T3 TaxID=3439062 RepID=UPI003F82A23B
MAVSKLTELNPVDCCICSATPIELPPYQGDCHIWDNMYSIVPYTRANSNLGE